MDKIAIGADHAGIELKEELTHWLKDQGYNVIDFGANSKESVDYPDYTHPLATAVEKGEFNWGIMICGSANGVAMTANKHQGIRAAICWNKETASLSKQHNNANIVCLPARFISIEEAKEILTSYTSATFEGGRHQNRVNKISCA